MEKINQFLSPQECLGYAQKIFSLREHYVVKENPYLATLGLASYQHKEEFDLYLKRAKQTNVLLWKSFSTLYLKLYRFFTGYFKSRICFHSMFSIPGFYIYDVGKYQTFSGGHAHFDLSHLFLFPATKEKPVLPECYSFTLSIVLPKAKTGLNAWEMYYGDPRLNSADDRSSENLKHCSTFIEYQVGDLVIFSSYQFHQISEITETIPTDQRITLQGHIINLNNNYIIFW